MRLLMLVHRYLGIAVGALMVMWCVSGIVMMYVGYPKLAEETRLQHLAAIDWSGCCQVPDRALSDDWILKGAEIEMLAGRPVLRVRTATTLQLIDLRTGAVIDGLSAAEGKEVVRTYAEGKQPASPELLGRINYDQWTVSGDFNADRPFYRFGLNRGAEVYVSSTTGRAVQMTGAGERFWNWLGAIPHWLYFTELRHKPLLWREVVIATSLMGCFLAVIGIYIGITQFIRRPVGRWSQYRGFNLWHHLLGVVFGLLALTWTLSGFLSMNPWGLLEGEDGQIEIGRLRGMPDMLGADLKGGLAAFARIHPDGAVSVRAAPLGGRLYFVATNAVGERHRFDQHAAPTPLADVDLINIKAVLGGTGAPPVSLMTQEDSYYFSHHQDLVRLPVYRMILPDGTRYYLDTVSGALVSKVGRGGWGFRWFHQALHRLDFSATLRGHPQWDALMLVLMSGVTALCVTGAFLAYRRVAR